MLHTGPISTHRRVQTKSREVQPPFRLSRQDATHCTFHIIQGFEEKRENSSLKRMDCPSYLLLLLFWNFPQNSPTFQQFCNFMQFCCIITAQRRKIQPVPRTQPGWPGKAASWELGQSWPALPRSHSWPWAAETNVRAAQPASKKRWQLQLNINVKSRNL